MGKFITSLYLPSYMADVRRRLRITSFMELAQEIAGKGSEHLGFGDSTLSAINAVWVLARMHVRFIDTPHRDDKVRMETWHRGLKGAQYLRDYRMTDEGGRSLVTSTSSWLIMDMTERKLLYGAQADRYVDPEPQCPETAIENPCPKISVPAGMIQEPCGNHLVCWSDMDYNMHVNNTRYVQWAMDALPYDITSGKDLYELYINFNKESHVGDKVQLSRGTEDGCSWFVEGKGPDGLQTFICKLTFR